MRKINQIIMIKDGRNAISLTSIYLNGVTKRGGGSILFFDPQTAAITISASTYGLYVNSSNQLIYWNGTTSTTLGSSGSIVSYSLDDALKFIAHLKSFLINGENPYEGNPQQASESCAVATTEWKDLSYEGMRQSELCV
jgi:hypothetical protein